MVNHFGNICSLSDIDCFFMTVVKVQDLTPWNIWWQKLNIMPHAIKGYWNWYYDFYTYRSFPQCVMSGFKGH